MKLATCTMLFSLLLSAQVHAWVITADFESGQLGQNAAGTDAFAYAGKLTVFDNTRAQSGKRSAKATIKEGTDGWNDWGGSWRYPKPLQEGDELWYRVWLWIEPGWDWNVGSKGTRFHTISAKGVNGGYLDNFFYNNAIRLGSEVSPTLFFNNGDDIDLPAMPKGSWQSFERYIKWHSVPGQAIDRVWINGVLVFEDKKTNTLRDSTSVADFVFQFGFFDGVDTGGAPNTQTLWIDNIVMTNERPSETDKFGNSFIGVGNANITAPPNPPGSIN